MLNSRLRIVLGLFVVLALLLGRSIWDAGQQAMDASVSNLESTPRTAPPTPAPPKLSRAKMIAEIAAAQETKAAAKAGNDDKPSELTPVTLKAEDEEHTPPVTVVQQQQQQQDAGTDNEPVASPASATSTDDSSRRQGSARVEAGTKLQPSGRVHRVWARVGTVDDPAGIPKAAGAGLRRVLDAFADDYYAGTNLTTADRETPNRESPYFTVLSPSDIMVTDPQGRPVPEYTATGESRIDVVFSHVDGMVPGWMDTCRKNFDKAFPGQYFDESRYRDNGELRYATRSFVRHAGHMVRRIVFLVEDAQHVEAALDDVTKDLARAAGIELVVAPHAEVFPDPSVLPVYNSMAIESVLNKVPGVAPLFIYANDDTMIGRKLSWFDIMRPMLIELPSNFRVPEFDPSAEAGLGQVPWAEGDFAMSVLARREAGGSGRMAVFVELEAIPLAEFKWRPPRGGGGGGPGAKINPEVAEACGPRSYSPSGDEMKDMSKARRSGIKTEPFSQAKVNRINMEHLWNYGGTEQTHWNSHNVRLMDRALLSLMLDGDEWDSSAPSLLPADLVRRTRGSRFRENFNLNPSPVSVWMMAAENRRRQKQLLAHAGYDRALKEVLKCTECRGGSCSNDPPGRANAAVTKRFFPESPGHNLADVMKAKLFEPVLTQVFKPEYAFDFVGSIKEIHQKVKEHLVRSRLWITINDHYDSVKAPKLPDADLKAFDQLLRVVTDEPGCCPSKLVAS